MGELKKVIFLNLVKRANQENRNLSTVVLTQNMRCIIMAEKKQYSNIDQ